MPLLAPAAPVWKTRRVDEAAVERLAAARALHPLLARLLVARGISDPEAVGRHLQPSLMDLHDPRLLPGMDAACERIVRALGGGETILVHGDYDVDGVTGTALLVRLLRQLGARVEWHIPNRLRDGYAFGRHSVERARAVGATLVVSVDNGTSSVGTIAELRALGIETVVTDHHEPPAGELPPAAAIVNPKLASSRYPFRELCGGAVAFKLAWGVCQELSGGAKVRDDLRDFLVDATASVAIATVCDVVPLVDENRILASYGLRALGRSAHAGVSALMRVAGLERERVAAEDVAFQVGPRLNACGRLGSARTALELLLCTDEARARELAGELDRLNVQRKQVEAELYERALVEAERFEDPRRWPVLVVAGQGWHQGVAGIVAARLARRFARPALVIGLEGEAGRGSARSVEGVDVLALLDAGAEHTLRHGGHAQAAGCEVAAGSVDALREAMCARAGELGADRRARPPLWIDAELSLSEMTPELMRQIERLEPFGERNEEPVLCFPDLRLAQPPSAVGAERSHLVLELRSGAAVLRAVGFGLAARAGELSMGRPLRVVASPRWNVFRGVTRLELRLQDFRAESGAGEGPARRGASVR